MFTSVDTFSRTLAAAVSQQSQVKRAQSALLLGCQDLAKGFQLTFGARDFGMSISSICTRHVTFFPIHHPSREALPVAAAGGANNKYK